MFSRGLAFMVFSVLLCPSQGKALPQGGEVVGGTATIDPVSSSQIDINQATDRAMINWNQFNIDLNEQVRFVQPNSGSVALNQVTGGDPSSILGSLSANGRVFLVNPNGILFGPTAKIDVAGLLATTLQIDKTDFMSGGRDLFSKGGTSSYVINQGKIKLNTDNGFVFLIAPGVKNEGVILARMGKVVLGSGESLAIDFTGSALLQYVVQGAVLSQVRGLDGSPLTTAVDHRGSIQADGGEVALSASASSNVFTSLINQEGMIQAKQIDGRGGVIRLVASDSVENGGSITTGENGEMKGESVMIEALHGSIGAVHAPLITKTASLTLTAGRSFFVENHKDLSTLKIVSSQTGGENNAYSIRSHNLVFDLTDAGAEYRMNEVRDTTGLNLDFTGDEAVRVGKIDVGPGAVSLASTAGSILDDGDDLSRIVAGDLMVKAGAFTGSIGKGESNLIDMVPLSFKWVNPHIRNPLLR
jgi:filamentous hemagglutinin family protein